MVNILLNINNFSEDFAYDSLKEFITKDKKVLIIPLSFHEDWIKNEEDFNEHYAKGKEEYEDIAKEFMNYGIKRKNIKVVNYFKDSRKQIKSKLYFADIIFFTGGYPDKTLYRIDKLGIRNDLLKFKGIIMGTSAGAMIQFDKYHVTPEEEGQDYEYHDGLGMISGFDIEVHYEDSFEHLSSLIIDLKLHDKTIFALPNYGGLIYNDGNITLLGDAFELNKEDIDIMQDELDEILGC